MKDSKSDLEFVCLSEEDYDELCLDVSYWAALAEILSERLSEHGLMAVVLEDEIWTRIRANEGGSDDLN